jgi:hypothetical protein
MKVSQRGRFRTLVHANNAPIDVIFETTLVKAPHISNGKMYATVSVDRDDAFQKIIVEADMAIKVHEPTLDYSPLFANGTLVIKIAPNALADQDLAAEDRVRIHMRLGNFGGFGYCWIASNIFRAM